MRHLARRHGPAMLLRLGEVPTVVVSSREGAREVMKTHDKSLAMRPVSATMRVLTNGGQDIVFAPYGDYWRQLRKIAVVELFTVHRVRSFRAVREEEVAATPRVVSEAAAVGTSCSCPTRTRAPEDRRGAFQRRPLPSAPPARRRSLQPLGAGEFAAITARGDA
ncbi:hypothetical protein ZWY2020_022341 [Hordeum vulgare]|nr:hypothetical protein ZWY2020_022341 [Hordeum vulgare]